MKALTVPLFGLLLLLVLVLLGASPTAAAPAAAQPTVPTPRGHHVSLHSVLATLRIAHARARADAAARSAPAAGAIVVMTPQHAVPRTSSSSSLAASLLSSSWRALFTAGLDTPPVLNETAAAEFIRERYGSSGKVDEVRSRIPRWGGPDELDPNDPDYRRMIVAEVAPGAALMALTLIVWVLYCAVLLCCSRPKAEGYTRSQRLIPLVIGSLAALVVLAFSIVGLVYTEQFDKSLSGDDGLTVSAKAVIVHTNERFNTLDNQMQQVTIVVQNTGDDIANRVRNLTDLSDSLPNFVRVSGEFTDGVKANDPITVQPADPLAGGQSQSYSCVACVAVANRMGDLVNAISGRAAPVFEQIEKTKQVVATKVLDARDSIQSALADAKVRINDVEAQANEYTEPVDDYSDQVDKYEKIRRAVVVVIFLLPIVVVVMFFVMTLCLKREWATKIEVQLVFFVLVLVWLIFLVHLPFSLLVADSCHYLDESEPDLQSVSGFEGRVGRIATACLAQQNLLSALDVAEVLAYANDIVFPDVPSADGLLNATDLDAVNNQVQSVSIASFPGYDPNAKFVALSNLNARTNVAPYNDLFTLDNVQNCVPEKYVTPDPTQTPAEVRGFRNAILTDLEAENRINAFLDGMKANFTRVMGAYDGLRTDTASLLDEMRGLQLSITPLLNATQGVLDIAYCTPLDDDYRHMKRTFCDDIIVSVSGMAMASFFIGLFMSIMLVCLWFLVHRLEHGVERAGTTYNAPYAGAPVVRNDVMSSPGMMGPGSDNLYGAPAQQPPVSARGVGLEMGGPQQTNFGTRSEF